MINKSGLKADPWWTTTFTENEPDSSISIETTVLQPLKRDSIFTKYFGTTFCLKEKQIASLGTRSKAFSRSTIVKNFLLLALNFLLFLLNSRSPWHKPILHFINIYHHTQTPIQNLPVQFKSMFQQLYSPIKVWIKGVPFPFKNWY